MLGRRRGVCFVDNRDRRFLASVEIVRVSDWIVREVYAAVEKEKENEKGRKKAHDAAG